MFFKKTCITYLISMRIKNETVAISRKGRRGRNFASKKYYTVHTAHFSLITCKKNRAWHEFARLES